MGIPGAADIMNAVVLTAVLSCLNSGLYTSSRMLFVLAARREAPLGLMSVSKRGVPMAAILSSTVVGFLCVIAAAVSPDTVFLFLLNSSGAIILFVYLLIAVSQIILRRRTAPDKLTVKMWLFPALSIVVVVGHPRRAGPDGSRRGGPPAAAAQPLPGRSSWSSTSSPSGCAAPRRGGRRPSRAGRRPACWCSPTRRSTATS